MYVVAIVGREPIPKEGGEGRGLQDCDQKPRSYNRAMHEAKQHNRHLRGESSKYAYLGRLLLSLSSPCLAFVLSNSFTPCVSKPKLFYIYVIHIEEHDASNSSLQNTASAPFQYLLSYCRVRTRLE